MKTILVCMSAGLLLATLGAAQPQSGTTLRDFDMSGGRAAEPSTIATYAPGTILDRDQPFMRSFRSGHRLRNDFPDFPVGIIRAFGKAPETLLGLAFDTDGKLVAGGGTSVYRFSTEGTPSLVLNIAGAQSLNGVALLGRRTVLVAEDSAATVWKVDVNAGTASDLATQMRVLICSEGYTDSSQVQALMIASQIFTWIGIRAEFSHARSCPAEAIRIKFNVNTPPDLHGGALAWAEPYEAVHIHVFYDRVRNSTEPLYFSTILAYVLVHEITHILQGICRHSDSGIMKADWGTDDFFQMRHKALRFSEYDIDLIRIGLAARASRLAATSAGPSSPLDFSPKKCVAGGGFACTTSQWSAHRSQWR